MTTSDNNKEEGMGFAFAALETFGEVVLEVGTRELNHDRKKDFEGATSLLLSTTKIFDQNLYPSAEQLDSLVQEAKPTKNTSPIILKVKQWINSLIKFFKSQFAKRDKAELVESTISAIQEIKNGMRVPHPELESVLDEKDQQTTSATKDIKVTNKPINVASQELNTQNHTVDVLPEQLLPNNHHGSVVPPSPPAPPMPQPTLASGVGSQGDFRGDFLDAIRQGKALKSVGERKLNELPSDANDLMDELARKLKARRITVSSKDDPSQSKISPSARFLAEATEFEKARAEEEARQTKWEKEQAPRIEAALKVEQEKSTKVHEAAKVTTPNVILKPGEIPLPPPPPPSPLSSPSLSPLHKISKQKLEQQKNKNFIVEQDELEKAMSKLKPTRRDGEFINNLVPQSKDKSHKSEGIGLG